MGIQTKQKKWSELELELFYVFKETLSHEEACLAVADAIAAEQFVKTKEFTQEIFDNTDDYLENLNDFN